jgi:hypothetical protein
MTWISVNEKLPAELTRVLVLDSEEGCITVFYNAEYNQWFISCSRQWYDLYNSQLNSVIHWMPLLEYKGM